jgi:hypothetical protein
MVEEVGCNLKVVERSEATAYVVLERSVKVVERIVCARRTAEFMRVMRHQDAGLSSSLPTHGCRGPTALANEAVARRGASLTLQSS